MSTKPMSDEALADARDLAARIECDGEWAVSEAYQSVVKDARREIVCVMEGSWYSGRNLERDAEDIVASRNTFPSLLAEIDRLTKERDEARAGLDYLARRIDGYEMTIEFAEDIAVGRRDADGNARELLP